MLPLSPPLLSQDFNPDDFLSQTLGAEEGSDLAKSQIAGLMSSSHVPYILNRLNISISSSETGKGSSWTLNEITHSRNGQCRESIQSLAVFHPLAEYS